MSFLLTQDSLPLVMVLTAILGGYLSGSVPYGLILTRIAGLGDIRQVGSGNIGATNVLRAGGKKLAIVTLLLDGLKGAVPVLIARHYHMDYAVLAALGAFLGHLFPVWLKFKGGKGVATGIGVMLGLWWQVGVAIICIWLLVAAISRYSSLSALTAFGLSPLLSVMLTHNFQIIAFSFVLTIIIWAKHHQNIRRLIDNTESKISLGGKK